MHCGILVFHVHRLGLQVVLQRIGVHLLTNTRLLPSSYRHVQALGWRRAVQANGARFEEFGKLQRSFNVAGVDRT